MLRDARKSPGVAAAIILLLLGLYVAFLREDVTAQLWVNLVGGVAVCAYAVWTLVTWLWNRLTPARQAFWFALLSACFVGTYGSAERLLGWDTQLRSMGWTCTLGFTFYGLYLANAERHQPRLEGDKRVGL